MFFQPRTDHIGLDISDHSLKAIQLKKMAGGKLKIVGVGQVEIEPGVISEGEIKYGDKLISAIGNLLLKPIWGKFTTTLAVVSLPENKTFIKMIDIPSLGANDIEQAVKWEAEHHIPIPFSDTYWDWQKIEFKPALATERLPVLLAAAPKDIVDSYQQILTRSHLTSIAMEIEAQAIVRSLIPRDSKGEKSATIIIDIGANHTSLIMFSFNTIQFTVSLPISGRAITQTIAQRLQLDSTPAEAAKQKYGLDEKVHHGAIYKILQNTIDDLIHRLRESLVFYNEHFPNNPAVGEVLLCGGGANCKNMDKVLQTRLQIPVKLGNPWCNINARNNPLAAAQSLSFATAIGLALRGLI